MQFKILQWNIGGALIRREKDDKSDPHVYKYEGLTHICDTIRKYDPDVVALQEVHGWGETSQAHMIAETLGWHAAYAALEPISFMDSTASWGLGLVSKIPIKRPALKKFENPKWKMEKLPDVAIRDHEDLKSYDYGVFRTNIDVNDLSVSIGAFHVVPFRFFNKDPYDDAESVRKEVDTKLKTRNKLAVVMGDLNFEDPIEKFLPSMAKSGFAETEISEGTYAKDGKRYDHVYYKGLKNTKSEVLATALTDHYPIYSEFEIQ